jgi:hypothetical protein
MNEIVPFEGHGEEFEQRGLTNGGKYWLASHFMEWLGYTSFASFEQAVNKAIGGRAAPPRSSRVRRASLPLR